MLLSDAHIHSLGERFPRLAHLEGAGEKTFGAILAGIEVVGVAGTMSYLNARHAAAGRNAYEVAGVPADLALGLLFSGLAITGYFGEHAKHGHNVGFGFLAAYAARMGTVWGRSAQSAHQALGERSVRGAFQAAPMPMQQQQQAATAGYPWAA
jgi:hypothetical protein